MRAINSNAVKSRTTVTPLQYFAAMDKQLWIDDPTLIQDINVTPALPVSLKLLKHIAGSHQQGKTKFKWRTTQFNTLVVLARILSSPPKLVLTDNTATLVHEEKRQALASQPVIKNHYYRLVFQITSSTADFLQVVRIDPATAQDVSAHMADMVAEGLLSQVHQMLVDNQAKGQSIKSTPSGRKEEIIRTILSHSSFTMQDIQREIDCENQLLAEILGQLCDLGKIGDIGREYIVFSDDA